MTREDLSPDCVACREAIAADPRAASVASHLGDCAACREFRDEMQAFDARLVAALTVPVPELRLPELPDLPPPQLEEPELLTPALAEVELARVPPPARPSRRPGFRSLALAATLVAAIVLGVRFAGNPPGGVPLGEQILAHISHETFSLVISDQAVGSERLARVVPASIARLGPDAGLVTYAQSCTINGRPVPHLVVQGEHGPVTILLMPEESVSGPERFSDGVLTGVILPVGDGSIAIVGQDRAELERLSTTIRDSVAWRT